ncbi:uncharacterized protein LOC116352352 [Contarinia nasturtii]|uniref:uncharacterized protein LOC116352352 n=1 Tax=Contarinia nasturtii TaxID=265458 RepID=UPI0012D43613|nr:uncharacterized protein LOC116352352 [Contarinia nasturtii]XP_031640749.1 uncharacterized protein LOC116352352 [Contarinia nasturtii]
MNRSVMDFDDENVISRVAPWKNKEEFDMVYDWLFGSNSNDESKKLALYRIKLWKMRRGNLTPASILSTLSILNVQLKDKLERRFSDDELRSMYSNAFTRFINYMSSIMRSNRVQSMYSTARELGIEPFLVDLRHLCAHGQVLPSLDILRRTTVYCMNWMREFYWERERNFITDAMVHDVHLKSSLELKTSIGDWFDLYDTATEALILGCKNIDDLTNILPDQRLNHASIERLQQFSEQFRNNKLTFIANKSINMLALLSNSNERDRGDAEIYCDVLFECQYFMKRSAEHYKTSNKDEKSKFIGIHQNLFRMLAICDFINTLFMRMLNICEDELEDEYLKKAASFWTNEIATGFLVFKEFKMLYKMKREKNSKFDVDMAPINTDIMTDDIKKIYKELGVNYRGTLIFGDTVRRPWSLQFDCDFLIERSTNINEYTVDIVKKCVQLIEPALNKTQTKYIERLLAIYLDEDTSMIDQTIQDDKIHTLEDYTPNNVIQTTEAPNAEASIWRQTPDGLNWKSCPIGSFP